MGNTSKTRYSCYRRIGIIGVLICALCFSPLASAGFFGALAANAKAHYAADKAKHEHFIKAHPILGVMALGAGGEVVHKVVDHSAVVPVLAVGTVGALVGGAVILHKYHCRITGISNNVRRWTCDGVEGAHPWKQEAKDLYILAKTRELRKNMHIAYGYPMTIKGCAAHHIVPPDDGRYPNAEDLRDILKRCDIGLNDAINGVWLPYVETGAHCKGVYHPGLHGNSSGYYQKVLNRLNTEYERGADQEESCANVRDELGRIKENLMNGINR